MLGGLKSNLILSKIIECLQEKTFLELIRYSKKWQKNTKKSIENYKSYNDIEIELIPNEKLYEGDLFINYIDERRFFHIYFNNSDEEIRENYITRKEKISKIKVVLDSKITSLNRLFKDCKCLKEIKFTKFHNKYITGLTGMFEGCTSLIKLDISKMRTENVTHMDWMFYKCESLPEINVQNFKTDKVTDMSCMFKHCFKIKELNLSNFNTSNVTNMKGLFFKCLSLEKVDLSNFNTSNVTDMRWMFNGCSSLMDLNILNFDTSNVENMEWIFEGCSPLINLETPPFFYNGEIDFESIPLHREIEFKINS